MFKNYFLSIFCVLVFTSPVVAADQTRRVDDAVAAYCKAAGDFQYAIGDDPAVKEKKIADDIFRQKAFAWSVGTICAGITVAGYELFTHDPMMIVRSADAACDGALICILPAAVVNVGILVSALMPAPSMLTLILLNYRNIRGEVVERLNRVVNTDDPNLVAKFNDYSSESKNLLKAIDKLSLEQKQKIFALAHQLSDLPVLIAFADEETRPQLEELETDKCQLCMIKWMAETWDEGDSGAIIKLSCGHFLHDRCLLDLQKIRNEAIRCCVCRRPVDAHSQLVLDKNGCAHFKQCD